MYRNSMILLTLLLAVTVSAQGTERALGFGGGMISGSGFSYRQYSGNLGFQVNIGALSTTDGGSDFVDSQPVETGDGTWHPDTSNTWTESQSGRFTNFNIGIQGLYSLHQSHKSKFYVLAGVAVYQSSEIEYEQDYRYTQISATTWDYVKVGAERKGKDTWTRVNIGAGIGFEYYISDNIHLAVEFPLTRCSNGDIFMHIPQGHLHYWFR